MGYLTTGKSQRIQSTSISHGQSKDQQQEIQHIKSIILLELPLLFLMPRIICWALEAKVSLAPMNMTETLVKIMILIIILQKSPRHGSIPFYVKLMQPHMARPHKLPFHCTENEPTHSKLFFSLQENLHKMTKQYNKPPHNYYPASSITKSQSCSPTCPSSSTESISEAD